MPSGLTEAIYNDTNTSLRDYLLRCSKQFGATAYHRDESGLPRLIEEEEHFGYLVKSLADKKAELVELKTYSLEQWAEKQDKEFQDRRQMERDIEEKHVPLRERYDAMIQKVEDWPVPTALEPFKAFCIKSLQESKEFDAGEFRMPEFPRMSARDYRNKTLTRLTERIARDEKELAEKRADVIKANKTIQAFLDSLPAD